MREFIKSTDRRRLQLIELLFEVDHWITTSELADKLNTSPRNLKDDLAFIRDKDSSIQLESSPQGIRSQLNPSNSIQEYYQSVLKSTLAFQILEEIFFNDKLTVYDLAFALHTSPSTVYRTIDQLNDYFVDYDCRIESNPCQFVGNERFIRNYYRAYFKEVSTFLEWPFRNFAEQAFDNTFNSVINFLERFVDIDISFMDFATYETVKLLLTVSIIRVQQGHFVDTTDENNLFFNIFFNAMKFFVLPKELKAIGGQKLTPEYIYQLFYPYLKEDMAYGIDSLEKLCKKNPQVNKAVSFLKDDLQVFSEKIGIDINLDTVVATVYGTTYLEDDDPNTHYILYNRNKIFNQRIKHDYPFVYDALYASIIEYRKRLNRDLNPDKIHLLVYSLFTAWENLLVGLHTKYQQVSILVLSDGHYSHAKMIQNLLSFELRNNVTINTYQNREITADLLDASDCDLIISTFKLPDFANKETIIIDHYPSLHDINRIEALINKIIKKNNRHLIESSKSVVGLTF